MSPDDGAALFRFSGNLCGVGLATDPKAMVNVDPPDEMATDSTKSLSQRLRGVLYVVYENMREKQFDTFDMFYRFKLEEVITHFKNKIEGDR